MNVLNERYLPQRSCLHILLDICGAECIFPLDIYVVASIRVNKARLSLTP